MKSILIPTDFHDDTLQAMELTWRNKTKEPTRVVLLTLSPLPDSMLPLLFLSDSYDVDQQKERHLMDQWEIRTSLLQVSVELIRHHQYGASRKIMEQIVERFQIDSIIVPFSIQRTEKEAYQEALESIKRIGLKVTLMTERMSFQLETI